MRTFIKDCKWGRFVLLQGDMVCQYADAYGEWCEPEVGFFSRIARANSNVVEVGSHIGLHTIPLSRLADKGTVVAFEPQRVLHQLLCGNCALNNRANVFAYQAAVGSQRGELDVACTDYSVPWNYGSFSIGHGYSTEGKFAGPQWSERVQVLKLDEVPLVESLPNLALLKIDVEGQEVSVLAGAKGLIAKHKPVLFVENNKEKEGDDVIEAIRELGYQCYWFCSERFRPDNYNGVSWKLPGMDINMACFPDGGQADTLGLMKVREFADLKKGIVPLVR